MKFCHVLVLDDPEAIYIAELGATPLLGARVSDDDVIYSALAALRDSDSLSSFYSKHIRDSQGNVRTLSECVARAKDLLRANEERFQSFVHQIVDSVKAGNSTIRTPLDLHRAVVSLTNGWHIARCGQPLNEDVRVLRILYVYFAFVVFCARDYLAFSCVNGNLNDYEDARLCQHVRLDIPCTIITADRRQRDRLKEIFTLLETVTNPKLVHAHQVLDEKSLP